MPSHNFVISLLLCLVAGLLLGRATEGAAQSLDERIADRIRARVEAAPGDDDALAADEEPIFAREALPRFYLQRQFAPAWSEDGRLRPRADSLLAVLAGADEEGLHPEDYHLERLWEERDAARARQKAGEPADPRRFAELDLLLTDAFMLYGAHLLRGRIDPETHDPRWTLERRSADIAQVLERALRGNIRRALHRLAPPQPEYAQLKAVLARYRRLHDAGGWRPLPEGATLRAGDENPRVAGLRERLRVTGDLDGAASMPDTAAARFDAALEAAVKRFQERHGLDADGVVGPMTVQALNVPVEARIRQIRLNLERWRWMPQDLGTRYVLVNIAAFELRVVERGEETLHMRVVTGQPYRQTPVFSDQISYLVLNPYWGVPHSIATKDILPLVKQNPNYLAQQNMTVFRGWGPDARPIDPASIDWSQVTAGNFPYRLRQDPGPRNALGRVKFMFPNKYSVYLHDTPSRDLFARSERSFSSGCIRLERPFELVRYLLADQPEWTDARIQQVLETNVERTVHLEQTVPVHLQYWTAWADQDGPVHFRRDIYARDKSLARALDEPAPLVSGL